MAEISVELLDTMGDCLSVVNAARVSFSKESDYVRIGEREHEGYTVPIYGMTEKDKSLLTYLAKHGHWSPFSHAFASFRIKAPIFVARQLAKHQVGLAWNEVSRRYVDDEPEFYDPLIWRARAENVKQGSSDKEAGWTNETGLPQFYIDAAEYYLELLESGVAPEQARMVLPQSTMTEWIWSGSLYAFARVCKLRLDSHAQRETQYVAKLISIFLEKEFPYSWKTLMENT